jgi:hypothetical protein
MGETTLAHLFAGRFDEALSWAEKALRDLPSILIAVGIIAASHALAVEWTQRSARCGVCAGSSRRWAQPSVARLRRAEHLACGRKRAAPDPRGIASKHVDLHLLALSMDLQVKNLCAHAQIAKRQVG